MYRFRLTAATRLPGLLRLDTPETSVVLPDGRSLFIVAREGATLATSKKLHFEAGGYDTKEQATEAGNQLRLRLRILNAALALGLNVPIDDSISSSLAQAVKDEAKSKLGLEVMDNVWGLAVFPDDGKHAEVFAHGEAEVYPSNPLYWFDGLQHLWDSDISLDDRSEDALALLGLASLEPSARSAFLVTYLALERLLPRWKRSEATLELIERLKEHVAITANGKRDLIPKKEENALLGSLAALHFESFRSALVRLADENPTKTVEGVPVLEFVKQCSDARNASAHPGKSIPDPEYARLTKGLRSIAMGVLFFTHHIPDLTINAPPSSVSVQTGGLKLSTWVYEQR